VTVTVLAYGLEWIACRATRVHSEFPPLSQGHLGSRNASNTHNTRRLSIECVRVSRFASSATLFIIGSAGRNAMSFIPEETLSDHCTETWRPRCQLERNAHNITVFHLATSSLIYSSLVLIATSSTSLKRAGS
jgi:hypothetical protein